MVGEGPNATLDARVTGRVSLINRSKLLYKSLDLKSKLPTMTEEEMLNLLASDGMLVKRPLIVGDNFALVGFKENEWSESLLK